MSYDKSLLETFISFARNSSTVERPVLECGLDQWTYGDLDAISSGIALQLYKRYGSKPTVAVVSENHPYILAALLATWKLNGIFVPLDPHAPLPMIRQMLLNVEATCVIIPEREIGLADLLKELNKGAVIIAKDMTMVSLSQQFLDQDAVLPPSIFPLPKLTSMAMYIHTSSATSVANLKCVQWTHMMLSIGTGSVAMWLHRAWPNVDFDMARILGVSPWSHAMGYLIDIGGGTFHTGGCLIMASPPSEYPSSLIYEDRVRSILGKPASEMDVLDRLLETALRSKPDIFACVPWVLEGFKDRYQELLARNMQGEALRVKEMLQRFRCLGVGGAAPSHELLLWAGELNIKIVDMMGMTEMARPLFFTWIDHQKDPEENAGYPSEDCLIDDATIVLLDDEGNENPSEGEFVITSKDFTRCYLKYDNSCFTDSADGRITFRTGDLYERNRFGRFVWKGRKEDYIQLVSGESLDPRPIEKALQTCSAIAHCCVVGNNFLRKSSDVICLIIQPSSTLVHTGKAKLSSEDLSEITRTLASINRSLLPPLRIAWSRVGILDNGVVIPYTKKGTLFRKRFQELFGEFIETLLRKESNNSGVVFSQDGVKADKVARRSDTASTSGLLNSNSKKSDSTAFKERVAGSSSSRETVYGAEFNGRSSNWKVKEAKQSVADVVGGVLGLDDKTMHANLTTSFAELGMDSNMAVRIVNKINGLFGLQFPLNACHNLIDLSMLTDATLVELGLKDPIKQTIESRDLPPLPKLEGDDVVIVGQALRLPGNVNTPKSFWEALVNKRDDIMTPVPAERWDHSSFYRDPDSNSPPEICDIRFKKAGFIDFTHYDNSFFGISGPEALHISPTSRLALETSFEALEDANIPISKLKGTKTGVFVGAMVDEGFIQLLFEEYGFDAYNRFYGTGLFSSAVCGRLSYLLDIHGPSLATDTACSTGLVIVDQAVKYIQSGDGDTAIVTAVNTHAWPGQFGFMSAQNMSSPNSRCATFTNLADGYVPSEASVSLILKSKSAAICDRDNILAVIKSTEVMHGGRTQGLTAPSLDTQIRLQRSLLAKAGLDPSHIHLLETHGTGTILGDLVEIQAINEVFRGSHNDKPLILGAAKTCFGHTEMAAGLVGLLKTVYSFQNAVAPGFVHLTKDNMNPSIDCNIVPIHIPIETTPLIKDDVDVPYRALVLSNGFSGTMAGVILEQTTDNFQASFNGVNDNSAEEHLLIPFVVSAKTPAALENYLKKYLGFCRTASDSNFKDICYTACVGREHYRHRFACVVSNLTDLKNQLEERIQSHEHAHHESKSATGGRVAFTFPGQSSQYQGMASHLASFYPDFRELVERNATLADEMSGFPIKSFLLDKETLYNLTIDDSRIGQICIFVYQYSMSIWLKTLGVEASAALGHSLGEIAAVVIAGTLTYRQGLEFVVRRAELLLSDHDKPGGMAMIAASEEAITHLIKQSGFQKEVVIAVYNDSESHVISGELTAVEEVLSKAKLAGLRGTKLKVTQGFHSPMISRALPDLEDLTAKMHPYQSRLNIPIYSTVYGEVIPADTCLSPSYWVEHAKQPVRLSEAATNLLMDKDVDILLDVGPQPFLRTTIKAISSGKVSLATSTKTGNDQIRAYLDALTSLFECGVNVNLEKLLSRGPSLGNKTSLPTYPFQRQRHYPNIVPSRKNGRITSKPANSVDDATDIEDAIQEAGAITTNILTPQASGNDDPEVISNTITRIVRDVLELQSSENIELAESLSSFGIDSIFFAQIKGRIMIDMHVEIPDTMLSDSLTIRQLIRYVVDNTSSAGNS
uniref:Uncharacterized protein n=1 Tax=Psilocybe cubensis TaxID=181762 RepID=A0A8H7XR57_PSICU